MKKIWWTLSYVTCVIAVLMGYLKNNTNLMILGIAGMINQLSIKYEGNKKPTVTRKKDQNKTRY